jgi:hypothetical protein
LFANMDHLETLKKVFRKLSELDLEELTEVTEGLRLTVPPNRQGKRSSVHRTIVQHLMSDGVQDEDDEGEEVFQQTETLVDALLAKRTTVDAKEVKVEVAGDTGGRVNSDGSGNSSGPTIVPPAPPSSTTSSTTAVTPTTTTTTSTTPIDQLAAMLLQQLTNSVRTSTGVQQTAVRTEVRRLTDFKINGVVGNGENQLDYAALM